MSTSPMTLREQMERYNAIARFLAMRDIEALTAEALLRHAGVPKVALLIVLGNSIPYITETAARACRSGLAEQLMIAGGIGHATPHLVESLAAHPMYGGIPASGRSEAEMLRDVAMRFAGLGEDEIILETRSANCGENARFALRSLRARGTPMPRSILLMQDPTMQRRTDATFRKVWSEAGESAVFVNYAAFVPQLTAAADMPEGIDVRAVCGAEAAGGEESRIGRPWKPDRYRSLVMGEIPRLRDDAYGYGPNGRGYIERVDIPEDVLAAFEALHVQDPERVRGIQP